MYNWRSMRTNQINLNCLHICYRLTIKAGHTLPICSCISCVGFVVCVTRRDDGKWLLPMMSYNDVMESMKLDKDFKIFKIILRCNLIVRTLNVQRRRLRIAKVVKVYKER